MFTAAYMSATSSLSSTSRAIATYSASLAVTTQHDNGILLCLTSYTDTSLTASQDDNPPPSKEDIIKGYQGSKEEFLQWRAEELAMVAKETAEVDAEVREHEAGLREQERGKMVSHLRLSSRRTTMLTILRRKRSISLRSRLVVPLGTRTTPPLKKRESP